MKTTIRTIKAIKAILWIITGMIILVTTNAMLMVLQIVCAILNADSTDTMDLRNRHRRYMKETVKRIWEGRYKEQDDPYWTESIESLDEIMEELG